MSFDDFAFGEVNTEDLLANFPGSELDQFLFPNGTPVSVKREPDISPQKYTADPQDNHNLLNIPLNVQQPFLPLQHAQPPPTQQSEQQLNLNMPSQILATDYPGDAEFEVYINPHHGKKSPWMYSSALGKIFIAMNQIFPIDFKWKHPTDNRQLYVRATPVYSETQHKNQLVTRCINHAHEREKSNENIPVGIRDHIIRCQERSSNYGGSKQNRQHLYVRIPLLALAPGCDSRQMSFQFMCKNSCTSESGMNRRPIEVVFTLEDENADVLGRRILKVRICSCPKRDKENEEKAHYQKDSSEQPHGKKRKLEKKQPLSSSQELSDTKIYKLEINIPGGGNMRAVLKAAHGILASELLLNKGDQSAYKKCIEEIQQKMNSPLDWISFTTASAPIFVQILI